MAQKIFQVTLDHAVLLFLPAFLIMGVAFLSNPLQRGLAASYYDNPAWTGAPMTTAREQSIDLQRMARVFPALKKDYSIRWEGFILIPVTGEYQFTLASDDGSDLFLDQQLLVENGGFHNFRERSARIQLERGFHPILLNYMQGKSLALLRAFWTRPGHAREALSNASFFAVKPTWKRFYLGWALECLVTVGKFFCLLVVVSLLGIRWRMVQSAISAFTTRSIVIGIFLLVFISHFFWSPITTSYDSSWSIHTALSILREGNTDLDEYEALIKIHQYYAIEQIHGHFYTRYPIGTSLLALPYVLFVDAFLARGFALNWERWINQYSLIPGGIETLIAANVIACAAVVIYLIGNLLLAERKFTLLLAFVFAFCTSAWSTASRALWQHGLGMLVLSLTLYLLLLAKFRPQAEFWAIRLASLPLLFSYVIRPTNSISVAVLMIFIFVRYRRHFRGYCLWSLLILIPFFTFHLRVYHALFPPYYIPTANQVSIFSLPFLEALAGSLVSPSRGLFIFSPILLFSLYGLYLKIKRKQMELLDYALMVIIIGHWITSAGHPHWWGGYSYGPRYFSEMIPYLIYFLTPVFANLAMLQGARKFALGGLLGVALALSFFAHYRGATSQAVYDWNAFPASVDLVPARVWDWQDIQFLRGL